MIKMNLFLKACFSQLSLLFIPEQLYQRQLYLLIFINAPFFLHFTTALLAIFIIYLWLLVRAISFLLNFLNFHQLSFAFIRFSFFTSLEAFDFAFRYILCYDAIIQVTKALFSIFIAAFSSTLITFAVLENFEARSFVFVFVIYNLLD